MKTAQWEAAAIYIDCPHCGEGIPNKSTGSFMHTSEDYDAVAILECFSCAKVSKPPKWPMAHSRQKKGI